MTQTLAGIVCSLGRHHHDRRPGALLYRIITFKILVTVAWVGYQYLHDRARGRIR